MISSSNSSDERGAGCDAHCLQPLEARPASTTCEQFIRSHSGWLTTAFTLFEAKAILTKVYAVDATLASRKLAQFAEGARVMSTSVRDLFQQASELDEHDRATLDGLLLESLEDKVDEDVEGLWKEEIERRLAELDTHSVQCVPWDEVKMELIRRTGAKRPD